MTTVRLVSRDNGTGEAAEAETNNKNHNAGSSFMTSEDKVSRRPYKVMILIQ